MEDGAPTKAPPLVALAMQPRLAAGVLTPAHLDRLRGCARLPDPEPLTSFEGERAEDLLARTEVLLTGWACPPIDEAVLDRAPALRAIVHAAGSVKGHVGRACLDRKLAVSSAAAANALPVAEYTLAAILFSNKHVFQLQQRYRELRQFRLWAEELPGLGNYRKLVGVVGASRIGRRVMELLRPFDLDVLVHDPTLSADEARALGAELVDLDSLLARADVVSLHAPLLPATRHMIDAGRLARMRDGAVLINTARGGLVDGDALTRELVSGRLRAVIDTTEPEVLPADSPLYELDNVLLTPHVAGSLGAETERMGWMAVEEIERYARGEPLQHAIRPEEWDFVA